MKHETTSKSDALLALEVLKTYAREHLMNPDCRDNISDDKLIASAISDVLNHDTELSLDIAGNLAEDVNYHDLAYIVRNLDEIAWRVIREHIK